MNSTSVNCIYYYCSIETFYKIIKNKSLLLTDMTKSNDSDEFEFIFKLYLDYLKNENPDFSIFPTKYLFEQANDQIKPFARCFSSKKDDLSLWRGYADVNGVSIGFDINELEKWIKKFSYLQKNIALKKVEYIDKDNYDSFKELFLSFEKEYPVNNYEKLVELSLFNKNIGFQDESEYRIAFPGFITKSNDMFVPIKDDLGNEYNLNFDPFLGFYFSLPFKLSMIKEIIVGPKNSISSKELISNIYFYTNEIDNDIVKSTRLTYR